MFLGDVPPSVITYGGIITNAVYLLTTPLITITLTHSSIGFTNYIVLAMPYSTRSSALDNNAFEN